MTFDHMSFLILLIVLTKLDSQEDHWSLRAITPMMTSW
jgi:hypothetical protein